MKPLGNFSELYASYLASLGFLMTVSAAAMYCVLRNRPTIAAMTGWGLELRDIYFCIHIYYIQLAIPKAGLVCKLSSRVTD